MAMANNGSPLPDAAICHASGLLRLSPLAPSLILPQKRATISPNCAAGLHGFAAGDTAAGRPESVINKGGLAWLLKCWGGREGETRYSRHQNDGWQEHIGRVIQHSAPATLPSREEANRLRGTRLLSNIDPNPYPHPAWTRHGQHLRFTTEKENPKSLISALGLHLNRPHLNQSNGPLCARTKAFRPFTLTNH